MVSFIIHTRFLPDNFSSSEDLKESERRIMDHIRSELPMVRWKNVKVIGPYEYLETFQAPDVDTGFKVKALMDTFENVHAELWKVD
jgi:hypothetical protein